MKAIKKGPNKKVSTPEKLSFDYFFEAIYWLMIFASPVLISMIFAGILYLKYDLGVFAIICLSIGVVIGFLFAERIRKKYGCMNYWSKIRATPELYKKEESD